MGLFLMIYFRGNKPKWRPVSSQWCSMTQLYLFYRELTISKCRYLCIPYDIHLFHCLIMYFTGIFIISVLIHTAVAVCERQGSFLAAQLAQECQPDSGVLRAVMVWLPVHLWILGLKASDFASPTMLRQWKNDFLERCRMSIY